MRTAVSLDRAGTVIASATQDVEPILERNRRLRGEPQASDWGRHVASIPNVILLGCLKGARARGNPALRMFTADSDALVARKLEDREWKSLRTDKGAPPYVPSPRHSALKTRVNALMAGRGRKTQT